MTVLTTLLLITAIVVALLLSLLGIIMSCLALSGTWVVALAAAVAALMPGEKMPDWGMVGVFLLIAALVEAIEFLAGYWGVRRRDGSRLASVVALVGGLAGMLLGTLIPVPFFGPVIGMIVLSFVLVYAVERHRLQENAKAAHIATGAVVSRVAVILLKVGTTLGMSAWLLVSLFLALW